MVLAGVEIIISVAIGKKEEIRKPGNADGCGKCWKKMRLRLSRNGRSTLE